MNKNKHVYDYQTLIIHILLEGKMQYKMDKYESQMEGDSSHRCMWRRACLTTGSAASPGEPSHVVSLLLGGLDEAKKLELRHSSDKTGTVGQAEEKRC